MLKFYYNLSPNPMKVALLLEELGLSYEAVPIDTRKGDQFAPEFLKVNPNGKVPAIVDGDTTVFDSSAILLYLADRERKFAPAGGQERAEFLSWLMFVATGIGPFSGQAVHFRHGAPEKVPYANTRYQFEANRHYAILNDRLADRAYLAGDAYSVVDMAAWGWVRMIPYIMGDDAWDRFPNLRRLTDEITARPAAQRVDALRERHPFKAELDDAARAIMFKHLATA